MFKEWEELKENDTEKINMILAQEWHVQIEK